MTQRSLLSTEASPSEAYPWAFRWIRRPDTPLPETEESSLASPWACHSQGWAWALETSEARLGPLVDDPLAAAGTRRCLVAQGPWASVAFHGPSLVAHLGQLSCSCSYWTRVLHSLSSCSAHSPKRLSLVTHHRSILCTLILLICWIHLVHSELQALSVSATSTPPKVNKT